MKKLITTTAIALAMTGAAHARDCSVLQARVDGAPAELFAIAAEAQRVKAGMEDPDMAKKVAAIIEARPVLNRAVAKGEELIAVIDEARTGGCYKPGSEGTVAEARARVMKFTEQAGQARAMVIVVLTKLGL